jgi:hypothetical protein
MGQSLWSSQILQLEEWNHPDVVNDTARPSGSETFQQLAAILSTGRLARRVCVREAGWPAEPRCSGIGSPQRSLSGAQLAFHP